MREYCIKLSYTQSKVTFALEQRVYELNVAQTVSDSSQ